MTNAVNIAQSGSNNVTFRNRIINGAMMIDQRNAGASVTPTGGQYTLDRWNVYLSQTSKLTVQQNAGSVTAPAGFRNYLGVTSSSAYSVISTDYFTVTQAVEGFNVADLGWGTASAAAVTLSFWVRSSLTGTFGGALRNTDNTRAYPFSYTISAANTWEQKTITIAGDTTGTWNTTNGRGIEINFALGVGPTFSGTVGAWVASNLLSATGATSVVGTNGATWYITGVQLERGSAASPFEQRLYGTELALCQRYYGRYTNAGGVLHLSLARLSEDIRWATFMFPAVMRTSPTVTITGANLDGASGTVVQAQSIYSTTLRANGGTGATVWITDFNASAEL